MVHCCDNGGREQSVIGGEWVLVSTDAQTSGFNAMLPRKEEQWEGGYCLGGRSKGCKANKWWYQDSGAQWLG
jgi:hypothetical protein